MLVFGCFWSFSPNRWQLLPADSAFLWDKNLAVIPDHNLPMIQISYLVINFAISRIYLNVSLTT